MTLDARNRWLASPLNAIIPPLLSFSLPPLSLSFSLRKRILRCRYRRDVTSEAMMKRPRPTRSTTRTFRRANPYVKFIRADRHRRGFQSAGIYQSSKLSFPMFFSLPRYRRLSLSRSSAPFCRLPTSANPLTFLSFLSISLSLSLSLTRSLFHPLSLPISFPLAALSPKHISPKLHQTNKTTVGCVAHINAVFIVSARDKRARAAHPSSALFFEPLCFIRGTGTTPVSMSPAT